MNSLIPEPLTAQQRCQEYHRCFVALSRSLDSCDHDLLRLQLLRVDWASIVDRIKAIETPEDL